MLWICLAFIKSYFCLSCRCRAQINSLWYRYVYFRIVPKNPKKGQIRTTKLVPTYHISLLWYISLTLFLTDQVSCSEILLSYHFFPFFIGLLLLCYMICTNYRGIFLKGWLIHWIRAKLSPLLTIWGKTVNVTQKPQVLLRITNL